MVEYLDTNFIFDISMKVIILFNVLLISILVLEYLSIAFKDYSEQHLVTLQKKRKASELRLEALKDQLSPHYLFNSLNFAVVAMTIT